jgi:hypothetical protein
MIATIAGSGSYDISLLTVAGVGSLRDGGADVRRLDGEWRLEVPWNGSDGCARWSGGANSYG